MPLIDVTAQNASLDNDYGASHGAGSPSSHELCLWVGDPTLAGSAEMASTTEVDDGSGGTTTVPNGYAPVAVPNDATWAAAADGLKQTAAPVVFADALAEWPDVATHWVLRDPATGTLWDYSRLSAPIAVTDAGPVPTVVPQVFFESWLDQ